MAPLRLALLTALTMVAFAANSVLNRMALAQGGGITPTGFAVARLVSGALVLAGLLAVRGRLRPPSVSGWGRRRPGPRWPS